MPNFGLWEFLVLGIIALTILAPTVYLTTGQFTKDLTRLRKMWHDTKPRDNTNHR